MASEQMKQRLEALNVSQRTIANACGISVTTYSQWLAGKYQGDLYKIDTLVRNFLEREEEKRSAPKNVIPYVQTAGAKRGFEVARSCHIDAELGVLYGDAGSGKTTLIKQYCKEHADAILIEADLGFTAKILFIKLHEYLGMDGRGTIHDMFEDVVAKLKGSGRLIVVDEAEHLPYRALEMLRRVYDKAECGVLLVGMPRLIMNLRGNRGEYAQIYSRIGISAKLPLLNEEDTTKIVHTAIPSSNGIAKDFFECSSGNARRLTKLMSRAQRLAELNGSTLTKKTVHAAKDMLVI